MDKPGVLKVLKVLKAVFGPVVPEFDEEIEDWKAWVEGNRVGHSPFMTRSVKVVVEWLSNNGHEDLASAVSRATDPKPAKGDKGYG